MKKVNLHFLINGLWAWLFFTFLVLIFMPSSTWAAFEEDREKPDPEFSRTGGRITAKLLPRAKSSSILIDFEVSGGKLAAVRGMDFDKADGPSVDQKDFKSALFVVEVQDLAPGAETKVSIISDFFIRSTQYWIYNPKLDSPWMDSKASNLDRGDRIQELVIGVKDGGVFDSDGVENGKIIMVGGPKDSFWGYALGTLFIRYFGIFLVLCILMLGMLFSGKVFQYLERRKAEAMTKPARSGSSVKNDVKPDMHRLSLETDMAAAIATALHMHLAGLRSAAPIPYPSKQPGSWAQQGRQQIMGERMLKINRNKH